MARRPSTPKELREAVERTVEATIGSAGRSREAAQGALDDMVSSVDDLRKGAEQRLARRRRSVTEAIEGRRLASYDDIRELKAELRALGRRLEAIEDRLPAKRAPAKRSPAKGSSAKGSTAKGSTAKGSTAKGSTAKGSTVKGSSAKGSTATRTSAKRSS